MKNKKRKKRIKLTPQMLIFVLLLLVILRNIYTKQFKGKVLELSKVETFENTVSSTALILKEEYLMSIGETLNIEQESNAKISAGSNIGSINGFKNNLDLNLEEAKKKHDYLNKKENIYLMKNSINENDSNLIDNGTNSSVSVDDIYDRVNNEEFDFIYELTQYDDEYLKENREELNFLKNKYSVTSEVLGRNGKNLKSPVSGVLNNKIDGYEDILNPYNIELANFDFTINKKRENNSILNGTKIVNNNFFYVYFKIPKSKLENKYNIGKPIKLKILNDYLLGTIKDIYEEEKNIKFLVYFDNGFNLIEDRRFVDFKVIKDEKDSFLVPTKSLFKKNDLWGLFVKNPSGIVEFKPVKILGEKDKKSYIEYEEDSQISLGGKKYQSVSLFDEVILYPNFVEDNELLE